MGYFTGYDIKWYLPQAQTENCSDHVRLVAFTVSKQKENSMHDLFIVFNTSHITRIAELPDWPTLTKDLNKPNDLPRQDACWVPIMNTSVPPSLGFTNSCPKISTEMYRDYRKSYSVWINNRQFPMLPYSCAIFKWCQKIIT